MPTWWHALPRNKQHIGASIRVLAAVAPRPSVRLSVCPSIVLLSPSRHFSTSRARQERGPALPALPPPTHTHAHRSHPHHPHYTSTPLLHLYYYCTDSTCVFCSGHCPLARMPLEHTQYTWCDEYQKHTQEHGKSQRGDCLAFGEAFLHRDDYTAYEMDGRASDRAKTTADAWLAKSLQREPLHRCSQTWARISLQSDLQWQRRERERKFYRLDF